MENDEMGGVVVTGAARGIGHEIANALAKTGYGIVIADVDNECGKDAAAQIEAAGGKAAYCHVDVTDRAAVAHAIGLCQEKFSFIHAIVNNAGFNKPQHFLETTEENWGQIMRVNGLGVLIGMQEAAKAMIAAGNKGKIVNTASIAGRSGDPQWAPYCASKAAVISLTQAGARGLAKHGITVNAFAPGVVETELWDQLDQDLMELGVTSSPGQAMSDFSKNILLGRTSTPSDVIGTVAFLISEASDYMTGQCLIIDGGMVLQ
jgi:meso-butanediol dehydrogenase/(S,S)-butanediol dehydrogenase/diacetyl reductase